MSKSSRSNDDGMGCLVILVLAVIAMPLVGLYLAFAGESSAQKFLGVALLIVGIIVGLIMSFKAMIKYNKGIF